MHIILSESVAEAKNLSDAQDKEILRRIAPQNDSGRHATFLREVVLAPTG